MSKRAKVFPVVAVEWEDTTCMLEWTDLDEAQAFEDMPFDFRCVNVGWLIRDDDECVVLAAQRTGCTKKVGLYTRIPRGMVLKVTTLEPR